MHQKQKYRRWRNFRRGLEKLGKMEGINFTMFIPPSLSYYWSLIHYIGMVDSCLPTIMEVLQTSHSHLLTESELTFIIRRQLGIQIWFLLTKTEQNKTQNNWTNLVIYLAGRYIPWLSKSLNIREVMCSSSEKGCQGWRLWFALSFIQD